MKRFCFLLAVLVAPCAGADPLVPAVEFGFSFGGAKGSSVAFLEFRASEFAGSERVDVINARISSSGSAASLLGIPLGKYHFLFQAEEEAASDTNWLWWGLGAAAVAGVVVLSDDDDKGSETAQEDECSTVGGSTLVPPSDDFSVDPSCV